MQLKWVFVGGKWPKNHKLVIRSNTKNLSDIMSPHVDLDRKLEKFINRHTDEPYKAIRANLICAHCRQYIKCYRIYKDSSGKLDIMEVDC